MKWKEGEKKQLLVSLPFHWQRHIYTWRYLILACVHSKPHLKVEVQRHGVVPQLHCIVSCCQDVSAVSAETESCAVITVDVRHLAGEKASERE